MYKRGGGNFKATQKSTRHNVLFSYKIKKNFADILLLLVYLLYTSEAVKQPSIYYISVTAQPICSVRSWPYRSSSSTIRFGFKKVTRKTADRNRKSQNNCSLLYSANSPPTKVKFIDNAQGFGSNL